MNFKKTALKINNKVCTCYEGEVPIIKYTVTIVIDKDICNGSLAYIRSGTNVRHCTLVLSSYKLSATTVYNESKKIAEALIQSSITTGNTETKLYKGLKVYIARYIDDGIKELLRKLRKERVNANRKSIANKKKKTK